MKICRLIIGFWPRPLNQSFLVHTMSKGMIHIAPMSIPPGGLNISRILKRQRASMKPPNAAVIQAITETHSSPSKEKTIWHNYYYEVS